MFSLVVLSCLLLVAVGSVVREQKYPSNGFVQHIELNEDTDIVNILEGSDNQHGRLERSYPRLGREATQTSGSDELVRNKRSMFLRFGRAATENPKKVEVTVENRHGIRVGKCPIGYTKMGGFCFKDGDY